MFENRVSDILRRIDPMGRLIVDVLGSILPSPLILGSGTLVEQPQRVRPFLLAGAGAVVPRTTRKVMERKTHPIPHLYQVGTRRNPLMLNAEWTGSDLEFWRPYLADLAETKQVIMSIYGRDIDGCVEVCRELDKYKGAWVYLEINISCAHSNDLHGMIARNSEHITRLISSIKDAGVTAPIALKMGHSVKYPF